MAARLYELYVLALTSLALTGQVTCVKKSGPFDYIIERIENCEDSGTKETSFPTKLSKVSRNKATLSGDFVLGHDIDENTKLYADVQQYSNQGYRPRAYQFTFLSCEKIFKVGGNIAKHIFAAAGANVTGCPMKAGSYSIQDMEFNFEIPLPVMTYNRFRMLVNIIQGRKKLGCAMFYAETLPKE